MNYYELLQISQNASIEVIKGAYKIMSKKYHPDVYFDGGAMMARINEAYEVLSDPEKRKIYDKSLEKNNGGREKYREQGKEENRQEDRKLSKLELIIGSIFYLFQLLVSGVFAIIQFIWGIILLIIIIGLFTGHTQAFISNLLS